MKRLALVAILFGVLALGMSTQAQARWFYRPYAAYRPAVVYRPYIGPPIAPIAPIAPISTDITCSFANANLAAAFSPAFLPSATLA